MKILLLSAALLIPSLFLFSCKKEESNPIPPPEEQPQINLTLEDVSCTEAWIKLSTGSLTLPSDVDLYRDSSLVETINLISEDTVLYVDSLLPNHTYKYQSVIQSTGQSSNLLSVTTMDTTSHNFSFQTWTFGGQAGSCVLNDVAIINENDIWAVGEIYLLDTLGQPDPDAYNLIHWNGIDWTLLRLQFYTFCGQPSTGSYPTRSILAFSDTDIWITSGSQITHFDGVNQIKTVCIPVSANKLWGTDDNNIYAVGQIGRIAHYQNGQWSSIESGTDLNFLDIYGTIDPNTNGQQILAVCTNNYPLGKAIFKIDGNSATQISSAPIQWELYSCWFIPNRHYYVVGDGIYEKQNLLEHNWKDKGFYITHYATTSIRGYGFNDVFIVGAFGEFLHFNGFTWKSYLPELGTINGSYGSVGIKGNLVAVTGFESAKAKIIIGKR